MAEGETGNPNQKLTPFYDGDTLRWVPVIEYYMLIGALALRRTGGEDDQESHTARA